MEWSPGQVIALALVLIAAIGASVCYQGAGGRRG